jgi:hypothetical protein
MALLLDYTFSTDPAPLQTSTAQAGTRGRVNVSVSDPSDAVYCNQLLVAVPLGDDPASLAAVANVPTASINTAAWNPTSVEVGALGDDPTVTWAKFTFRALSTDPADWLIGSANLVPSLDAIVNLAPGQFEYVIEETSGTDPEKLDPNRGSFTLDKVLPRFYVQNLVAVAPTAPTVPATEFALGAPILLEWEGNGTWYELYRKGISMPVYAGTATSCEIADGLLTDTTFVLVASSTGNPAHDSPSTGYETIVLYETLTLTVSNPALTPTSVKASGDVTAGGALGVSEAATIGKTLDVTGALSAESVSTGPVAGNSLSISGHASIGDGVTVGGASSLGPTNVNGNLASTGGFWASAVTTPGLNVNGGATVGALTANGQTLVNGLLALKPGSGNAIYALSSSGVNQIAGFYNHARRSGDYITGVVSIVGPGGAYGFGTNGKYTSSAGSALLTHLETRVGHRVVTSPLVLEEEVQISGTGRLSSGRATVLLGDEAADLVVHGEEAAYRVLVTPNGRCGGLAVVERSPDGFVVEELGDGAGEVEFDWLLISRKPAELGATRPSELPDRLPEAAPPSL